MGVMVPGPGGRMDADRGGPLRPAGRSRRGRRGAGDGGSGWRLVYGTRRAIETDVGRRDRPSYGI